jgi:hypothetical protein
VDPPWVGADTQRTNTFTVRRKVALHAGGSCQAWRLSSIAGEGRRGGHAARPDRPPWAISGGRAGLPRITYVAHERPAVRAGADDCFALRELAKLTIELAT